MLCEDSRRFAYRGSAVAIASGLPLLLFGVRYGGSVVLWGAAGWFVMSALGLAAGMRLTSVHGDPGPRFLAAMGACILARLGLAAAGAIAVAGRGEAEMYAYLVGLGAGYFPLQAYEMKWFLLRDRIGDDAQRGHI